MRQDVVHRASIDGAAGKGAVEVDEVEPRETLTLEIERLRRRIVVEHGGLGHVALDEADAAPFLQVDRGKQDHGRHLRKLVMRASPRVWLFSGWNWVPTTLSRPTMAVTVPP